MNEVIFAAANPEKRLFIELITRDITLADAILDIVDNSINAAMEPRAKSLKTSADYAQTLSTVRTPSATIEISVSATEIVTCH